MARPLVEFTLEEAEALLVQLQRQDHRAEMSDNTYYTSGRKQAMKHEIRRVSDYIEFMED